MIVQLRKRGDSVSVHALQQNGLYMLMPMPMIPCLTTALARQKCHAAQMKAVLEKKAYIALGSLNPRQKEFTMDM